MLEDKGACLNTIKRGVFGQPGSEVDRFERSVSTKGQKTPLQPISNVSTSGWGGAAASQHRQQCGHAERRRHPAEPIHSAMGDDQRANGRACSAA